MFPSQPQIGQDMAKERQQLAANIRLAQDATRPDRKARRAFSPFHWIRELLAPRRAQRAPE